MSLTQYGLGRTTNGYPTLCGSTSHCNRGKCDANHGIPIYSTGVLTAFTPAQKMQWLQAKNSSMSADACSFNGTTKFIGFKRPDAAGIL